MQPWSPTNTIHQCEAPNVQSFETGIRAPSPHAVNVQVPITMNYISLHILLISAYFLPILT